MDRVLLVAKPEGVYVFVFQTPGSKFPEKDYLEDGFEIAMEVCAEEYGIPKDCWDKYDGPVP